MRAILRNRTHWNYLVCLQRLAAKKCPISGNYVPSRTRICPGNGTGVRPSPKNDPGMSFGFKWLGHEGPPTHQDSQGGSSDLRENTIPLRGPVGASGRSKMCSEQQSRNVVLFQGGGERGYVTHQDSDARRSPRGRRGGRAGDSAKSADRMPFQGP